MISLLSSLDTFENYDDLFNRYIQSLRYTKKEQNNVLKRVNRKRLIRDNKPYKIPATIDDPLILNKIKKIL